MAQVEGSLTRFVGKCRSCGWSVTSRNVHGVASKHADRYGHEVSVETSHQYRITPGGEGKVRKGIGSVRRMAPLL